MKNVFSNVKARPTIVSRNICGTCIDGQHAQHLDANKKLQIPPYIREQVQVCLGEQADFRFVSSDMCDQIIELLPGTQACISDDDVDTC